MSDTDCRRWVSESDWMLNLIHILVGRKVWIISSYNFKSFASICFCGRWKNFYPTFNKSLASGLCLFLLISIELHLTTRWEWLFARLFYLLPSISFNVLQEEERKRWWFWDKMVASWKLSSFFILFWDNTRGYSEATAAFARLSNAIAIIGIGIGWKTNICQRILVTFV